MYQACDFVLSFKMEYQVKEIFLQFVRIVKNNYIDEARNYLNGYKNIIIHNTDLKDNPIFHNAKLDFDEYNYESSIKFLF